VFPGCTVTPDDGNNEDEEWVQVTQANLEGSDECLSRRIQLNLTFSSGDVTLTLERNDNVPDNVTVVVGQNGRFFTPTVTDVSDQVGLSADTYRS